MYYHNSLPASVNCFRCIFANSFTELNCLQRKSESLGPDQNFGLDLNPHCLTLIFLKEFFEKIFLKKKNQQATKAELSLDFEIRNPKALFAKKWESHHTKEYSLLKKIGVPASKIGVQDCKSPVSESSEKYTK